MNICDDVLFYKIFPFLNISDYFLFMQLSKNTYQFTHDFISSNQSHMKNLFNKLIQQKLNFFKCKISRISDISRYKHVEWYIFIDDIFYHTNYSKTLLHKSFNPFDRDYSEYKYYWSQYHSDLYVDIFYEIKNSFKNNYIKFKKKYFINK